MQIYKNQINPRDLILWIENKTIGLLASADVSLFFLSCTSGSILFKAWSYLIMQTKFTWQLAYDCKDKKTFLDKQLIMQMRIYYNENV